ncbi:hypothetical protein SLH46_05175 [Draconibacterium sp. IB214405]|uniref:glycosyl-4,4'-diaponeurosporenoate acyltransferase CrtO family protein n=1 Tax=Draconibacterium sp. IB214405 TaxID=3097352 RepID=UPI002A0BEE0B|nr:hypothetical protein [Draconibacterium sp. IB214405]MDX8338562.1 hypothetical protein [Draconibacterium sp. IB214405]
MSYFKKIGLPLLGLFLLYRTVDLLRDLSAQEPTGYSAIETVVLAFLLTLFITGVFALPGFAFPTNKILPNSYYRINNTGSLRHSYRFLGLKYYRYLLLIFFWGQKKNRTKYFDGTRNGLENLDYQSRQSEFGHMGAFIFIVIASVYLISIEYFLMAAIALFINIIGNLYPAILQRHHRMRVESLIKKFSQNS